MLSDNEANGQDLLGSREVGRDADPHDIRRSTGSSAQAAANGHLRLRLNARDLQRGGWVTTCIGGEQRLWVVEALTDGAGDGCIELTLRPKPL